MSRYRPRVKSFRASSEGSRDRWFERTLLLSEVLVAGVTVGNHSCNSGPIDSECGIVVAQAALMIERIKRRHLIKYFAVVLECLKTMRKSFGNKQSFIVVTAQYFREMLLVSCRFTTQVDYHIVDCASGTAHQFCFSARSNLIMHAAKRPLYLVERYVALDQSRIQTVSFELLLAPRPSKETPLIFVLLQLDDESSRQLCFSKKH